ncbi:MAG TPA: hypothetical protein DIW24_07020 [Bacteroidetes bacterium]|nr:hypothetical protein [Bacteroidota bacterium]
MAQWDYFCPGCFREKGAVAICPHCGFDEHARRSPLILPYRTLIGKQYITGRLLGKPGGFGITYLGFDTVLNTRVAIKEFFPRELVSRAPDGIQMQLHTEDDRALFEFSKDRFLHEARTLVRIDHPNVVRVRNYLEANGTAYIVMNYYEGANLSEYLEANRGKITEEQALGYLLPILSGLSEVHRKGFLHRDIKPGNIYITNEGRPILLDFGAARSAVKEQSRGLSVVLSPGFAPIEQYHRSGEQGTWTDVYGCAATLYYALTGKLPPEATERLSNDDPDRLKNRLQGVSATVTDAILKGLSVHPKERPQTVEAFSALLSGDEMPFSEQKTMAKAEPVNDDTRPTASQPPLAIPQTVGYDYPVAYFPTDIPTSQQPVVERRWDWTSLAIFFAGVLMALLALAVWFYKTNRPTQLIVSSSGQGDYRKIMEAVEASGEGMKIYVEPGTYREVLVLDRDVEIIARKEKGDVMIENGNNHVITVKTATPILKGFKVRATGKEKSGQHALYVTGGTPILEDCVFTSTGGVPIQISGRDAKPHLKRISIPKSHTDGIAIDQQAGGLIEGAEIANTKGWGVVILGAKEPVIQQSKIYNTEEGGAWIENGGGTLKEVEIYGMNKPGVQISRNAEATLSMVDIHDGKQNGIFISENSQAKIEKSKIHKNAFAGIAIRDGSDPVITETKIFDGLDNGVWIYNGGKGRLENVEIYGNQKNGMLISSNAMPAIVKSKIYGSKQAGILFDQRAKGTIDETEIYANEKTGIVIREGSDPLIRRSKVYDGKEAGILIASKGKGTIEYSQVFRNAFQNIHIQDGGNPSIRQTDIYDGQGGGVWVTDKGNGLVENCNIYNNARFGVGIEKQGDPTIRQSKIYGSHSHGVWISVGGRGTIQENQIYGNAEYGVYINPNTAPSLVSNTINSNGQGDVLDLGF